MYYAIFDCSTKSYLTSGFNSTSKEDIKEALLSYLEPDLDEEDLERAKSMKVEHLCSTFGFLLDSNPTKFYPPIDEDYFHGDMIWQ